MKHYSLFLFLACLLSGLLNSGTAAAQCSGQFSISYTNAAGTQTAVNYNNGANNQIINFCPDGSGFFNLTVTQSAPDSRGTITVNQGTSTGPQVYSSAFDVNSAPIVVRLPVSNTSAYVLTNNSFCVKNDGTNGTQKIVTVALDIRPSVSLTSSAGSGGVCVGTTVTLTATGGAATNPSYTFFANGVQIGQNSTGTLDVTPQASTTYTVQTASAGCNGNTATQAITVNTNNLTLSSSASNTTAGQPVTLTSTGGTNGSYTYTSFSQGVTTTTMNASSTITFSPTTTTRYTVTGPTAVGGCPGSATIQIQVGNTPLPVGLTSFTAAWKGRAAELRWVTAFETDNSHFVVERSFDGSAFRAVGRVTGAGTTSGATTNYRFDDPTPVPTGASLLYYRLRQVDYSGADVLSGVRALTVSGPTNTLAAIVLPNPTTGSATIRFVAATAATVRLEVYNALGRQVLLKVVAAKDGLMEIPLPEAAAWKAGVYHVALSQNQQRQVVRLVRR